MSMFISFKIPVCSYLVLVNLAAFAFPCAHRDNLNQAFSSSRGIIKVAEFGGSGRKTAEEYAKLHHEQASDVENRYASSGSLKCGTFTSGAELVMTKSTVLVALHGVFKDRSCELLTPLNQCYVRFQKNGVDQYIDIASIRDSGAPCPHTGNADVKNDWLILNLKEPANDLKPYGVRTTSSAGTTDVVGVGQSFDIYRTVGRDKRLYPMLYSDCKIIDTYSNGMLGTNCGTSGMSSGSGIFDQDRLNPHLQGINTGSSETPKIMEDAIAQHRIENRPYDASKWTSIYLPIEGRLQQALTNLAYPVKNPLPDVHKPSGGASDGEDI